MDIVGNLRAKAPAPLRPLADAAALPATLWLGEDIDAAAARCATIAAADGIEAEADIDSFKFTGVLPPLLRASLRAAPPPGGGGGPPGGVGTLPTPSPATMAAAEPPLRIEAPRSDPVSPRLTAEPGAKAAGFGGRALTIGVGFVEPCEPRPLSTVVGSSPGRNPPGRPVGVAALTCEPSFESGRGMEGRRPARDNGAAAETPEEAGPPGGGGGGLAPPPPSDIPRQNGRNGAATPGDKRS